MKTASKLLVLCLFLTVPDTISAQETPDIPRFLMFNQNMVPGTHVGTLNQLADSLMRPILDAMVDEGTIRNWGILTHNWGDEWNWYMGARDHASFVTAWGAFVSRLSEAHPGAFAEMGQYIQAHKDNLYFIRYAK